MIRSIFVIGAIAASFHVPMISGQEKNVELLTAWGELSSEDEAIAARAIVRLARTPAETMPFLKEHLRPVKADDRRVQQWLLELEDSNFRVRNRAHQELDYLGKYIKKDLRAALKKDLGLEAKNRIQKLLERTVSEEKQKEMPAPILGGTSVAVSNVNGQVQIIIDGKPVDLTPRVIHAVGPPRPWVRATRAIGLLESLATPDARAFLEELAQGEGEALPTIKAKEALQRLKAGAGK